MTDEQKQEQETQEQEKPEPQAEVETNTQPDHSAQKVDEGDTPEPTNAEPADTDGEVEKWKSMSRKWQKTSEQNKSRIDELEKQLAEANAARESYEAIAKVASETGVPIDLLSGCTTAEEAQEKAAKLTEWASKRAYPTDRGGAPSGASPITKESIENIKDPRERVKARAAHIDLYK